MQSVTQGLSVIYEAKPESVAQARAAVSAFAAGAGATAEQIDAVRLAVSEAVTNAVLHAYGGGAGSVQVTADVATTELWILVADEGGGMQPQADRPGLGLGLGLISQVSDSMAIVPRSAGGIEVRILFKLASCAPPAGGQGAPSAPGAAEMGIGLPPALSPVSTGPICD
jgi:stage II sporulation protein AB (anti-sigma F factor)